MRKVSIISIIFALLGLLVLFSSCADNKVMESTEPTEIYNWMSGECPISTQRTGLTNAGMNHSDYDVTANGIYFIYESRNNTIGSWLLYVDHGSDTVIKLCGRADCTHDTDNCDAYIVEGSQIAYYDSYLYVLSGGIGTGTCKLLRMDLNGTNRVEILDLQQFATENGFSFISNSMCTNGVYLFGLSYIDEDGNMFVETFYFKLDGTMSKPEAIKSNVSILYSCGDVILAHGESQKGGEYGGYYDWDPDTDTCKYLCDHPGVPGYFGEAEAYYFKNGAVRRFTYSDQREDVVIETNLSGNYYVTCFPDCLVIASRELDATADNCLYIYNWSFELVDTVEINYPHNDSLMTKNTILAETAERLILTDCDMGLPRYYIEKSELGTGNVEIYEFSLPELKDEIEYFDGLFASN